MEVGKLMTRERIEDLGRLAEMLRQIMKDTRFDLLGTPKYAFSSFNALSDDEKFETIHDLAYFLDDLQSNVAECQSIAEGIDYLNNEEE